MTCDAWRHDFALDPPTADWRKRITTCTRCGEVRYALTGFPVYPVAAAA